MLRVRVLLWTALVSVILFGLGACALLLSTAGTVRKPPQATQQATCVLPLATDDGGGTARLDGQQQHIASRIITLGRQRQLPPRAWQIALQAGKTESGLRNLAYGDRDSLGIFQMRPSMGWGNRQQLQDVNYQIHTFYDALQDIPRWHQLRPGDAAQRVERSAFPMRYHQHEGWARAVLRQAGVEGQALTGCAPQGPEAGGGAVAARAIDYARAQIGKEYVWGAEGPDTFDCSGLTMAAYQHAGVSIPRTSAQQYHAGQHIPLDQAQRGDLLFWANSQGRPQPEAIHHVGIYLGNNRVLHAPQPGETVEETAMWRDGIMPMAVRPTTPGKEQA